MSVNLQPYTTFHTVAQADELISLDKLSQLAELPDRLAEHEWIILGSGSNVLFADDFHGIVIHNCLKGTHLIDEDEDTATLTIAAGEIWHDTVLHLSSHGYYGLENLALIPGTVGAAPVQNIGAYGVEVADFIVSVSAFDLHSQQIIELSAKTCQFAYRDSVFKQADYRHRYFITAVTLKLSKHFTPNLSYQGLSKNTAPSTAEALIQRVIDVRQSKLPNPNKIPNAGSFFKNPIIDKSALATLQQQYTNAPYFTVNDQQVKIPAAWLIEMAGFKGHQRSNGAGVYEKHALILVNRNKAHGHEIYTLACDIMQSVKEQFDITITPEVRIVSAQP